MKQLLAIDVAVLLVVAILGCRAFAQSAKTPIKVPAANYDEAKVPQYQLPDPLMLQNGSKVTDTETWKAKRRPEILKLFAENVYGHTMVGRPKEMNWEVTPLDLKDFPGAAVVKKVTIYFNAKKDGPKMELRIVLPAGNGKPVPVFLMPGNGNDWKKVIARGYGLVSFDPNSIEPNESGNTFARSIRKFFAPAGQSGPGEHEWGTIGAWAWGMSRAMDYLETDKDIDAKKVCVIGHSRFGKTALWAGAQDERFAMAISIQSGCGGASLLRRRFGETVGLIMTNWGNWFAPAFREFTNRENELPVDAHMLLALMAPRPVYVSAAEDDRWADPRGQFLAAKNAEPVYRLFGKAGLDVDGMPAVDKPVGKSIGFHNRKGKHSVNAYDWDQFLNFADQHWAGSSKTKGNHENTK